MTRTPRVMQPAAKNLRAAARAKEKFFSTRREIFARAAPAGVPDRRGSARTPGGGNFMKRPQVPPNAKKGFAFANPFV